MISAQDYRKDIQPSGNNKPFCDPTEDVFSSSFHEKFRVGQTTSRGTEQNVERSTGRVKINENNSDTKMLFSQDSLIVEVQLHAFSDASEKAYTAVMYMRATYSNGRVQTSLITSKTRVAPVKKQTIPRLELLRATILARLVSTVINLLTKKIDPVVYWIESRTVLCWIRNEKPWKQYVRNRVDEIRQLTRQQDWRHCPSNVNPGFTFTQYDRNRVGEQFNLVEWTVFSLFFKRMAARSAYNRSK